MAQNSGPSLSEKFRGFVETIPERWRSKLGLNITKQKVPTATATNTTVGSAGVVESNLTTDQTNETLKTDTTLATALPSSIVDTKITTQYGGGILDVTETLSQGALTVAGSLTTVEGHVTDLGPLKQKLTEVLQDAAWPILQGTHVDDQTRIVTDYTKQVVAAGTLGGISGSDYSEVEPLDKWRSIKITSTVRSNTLPTDTTYFTTQRESFPAELKDLQIFIATNQAISSSSGIIQAYTSYNVVEGFSGPCNARITEKYMTEAQYATWNTVAVGTIFPLRPLVTQFFPQANRLAWDRISGTQVDKILYTPELPESLHEKFTFNFNFFYDTSVFFGSITLPQTKPAKLPYGEWIVTSIRAERWRLGVRVVEIVEVLVPENTDNE